MASHRPERVAEAIREVVSTAVLFEVNDPRVKGVTVLSVAITPDLREAKVSVSVMGTDSQKRQAMKGLGSATGFLQSRLANRLKTRFIPHLSFELDEGVKQSVAMSKLIDEVRAEDRRLSGEDAPEDDEDDEFEDDEDESDEDDEFEDDEDDGPGPR
jgi:ribosome-binding factor A